MTEGFKKFVNERMKHVDTWERRVVTGMFGARMGVWLTGMMEECLIMYVDMRGAGRYVSRRG